MQELLEAGKVKSVIDKSYPLSETAEAIRYLETGHARGKVVKVISYLLEFLPADLNYDIIFMERDIHEVLASQKKKSELLLGHEKEAKRQRQDAAAKTEALFLEASARKARSLKMQQLQETHELALALNQRSHA